MTEIAADATALEGRARADTVRRAAEGDEAAFQRLVSVYHASMARVAFVVCGDVDVARDATQSAWGKAWQRLGSLRDPEQVGAWLITIAGNEARQAMRGRRAHPVVDISVLLERASSPEQRDVAELVDLQRALAGLRAEDRQLLALRFVAGLDATEIARLLGGSPSGVRSRLARLIERLRRDLSHA